MNQLRFKVAGPAKQSLFSYNIPSGDAVGTSNATSTPNVLSTTSGGGPDTLTVEFWHRINTPPSANYGTLIQFGSWWFISVHVPEQHIWWTPQPNANAATTFIDSGIVMAVGEVHHWAFVFDTMTSGGYYITVYKDGAVAYARTFFGNNSIGSAATTNFTLSTAFNNMFGWFPTYYSVGYLCDWDEVRIWNTARSQAQIQANMNSQITTATTGLVARWGFESYLGTTIYDSIGSLHLTNSGTPVGNLGTVGGLF